MEKHFSLSPTPKDWLKILRNKKITNSDLDKVVKDRTKTPKPDTGGVTPGRAPTRTPEGTRDPSGKIKPHKPGQ